MTAEEDGLREWNVSKGERIGKVMKSVTEAGLCTRFHTGFSPPPPHTHTHTHTHSPLLCVTRGRGIDLAQSKCCQEDWMILLRQGVL